MSRPPVLAATFQVYDPEDAVARLALAPFLDGERPVARYLEVGRTAPLAADDLAVDDGQVTRWVEDARSAYVLLEGSGWSAALTRRASDDPDDAATTAWVYATDDDRLGGVCEQLRKALAPASPPAGDTVTVRTWTARHHRPVERVVTAAPWAELRRNYAAAVLPALDRLVGLEPGAGTSGRLALLHGVPGTGKSTFLRALARAWAPWCGVELLGDPTSTLGDATALETVLFTPAQDEHGEPLPWKLVVVEDAHDLVAAQPSGAASDALTRLLHATDGLVGGQARVLFLLTTNQRIDRIHPAILRPGRCLAEVEIPPLPAAEGAAWLGPDQPAPRGPMTLAELFAGGTGDDVIRHRAEPAAVGQYL